MMSVSNWLGFSLSPQPARFDAPDSSQQHSSVTTLSMQVPAKVSESSIGYDGSSDCYGVSEGNVPSPEMPEISPSTGIGSLCIMEALKYQAHSHGDPAWPRDFHVEQALHPGHMSSAPYPNPMNNHKKNCDRADTEYGVLQTRKEPSAPKLEDFLGGVSLGGSYAERDHHHHHHPHHHQHLQHNPHQRNMEEMYGFPQGSSSCHGYLSRPRIYPFSFERVNDDHAALSPTHVYEAHAGYGGQAQRGENLGLEENVLMSDCILQVPQGGNSSAMANNGENGTSMVGISALKTWLRQHQNSVDQNANADTSSSNSKNNDESTPAVANLQSLALSMSPVSQSSSVQAAPQQQLQVNAAMSSPTEATKKRLASKSLAKDPSQRKSIDTFGQRTSIYRGVTRHRWTGRYEAHLWDNSCKKEGQTRKGRQVYLGGYDKEDKAAKAYDLAALKYWGPTTTINFPLGNYEKELEEMKSMTRQEYVASLRRKSSGFSRGASIYRGVTRHHQQGRWQARIGRVAGNKDLYLGTFSTQEEAAEAYDIAAIKFRGINAVTNFEIRRYDVKRICSSPSLLLGDTAKHTPKQTEVCETSEDQNHNSQPSPENQMQISVPIQSDATNKDMDQEWRRVAPVQSREMQPQRSWYDPTQQHYNDPSELQVPHFYQNFLQPQPNVPPSAVLRNLNIGLDHASVCSDPPHSNAVLNISVAANQPALSSNYTTSAAAEPDQSLSRSMGQNVEGNSNQSAAFGDVPMRGSYQLYLAQAATQTPLMPVRTSYDGSNILGSAMAPIALQNVHGRPLLASHSPHMPIFAVWNET